MPAAAVTAAGAVAVGYLQHKSASNAAKAQQKGTDTALAYQKERDALGDKRYNDAWSDYTRRHDAWEQRNFGAKGAPGGATTGQSAGAGGWGSGMGVPTLADLGAKTDTAPMQATIADMGSGGDWTDWNRYLAQGQG